MVEGELEVVPVGEDEQLGSIARARRRARGSARGRRLWSTSPWASEQTSAILVAWPCPSVNASHWAYPTVVAWLGVAHVRAASRTAGLNLLEAASCWAYIPVRVAELLSTGAPAVGEPLKDRAAELLGVELKVIGIKLDYH